MINDSLSSSYPSSSSSSNSLLFFFFFYWQGPKVKTTARYSHLLSFAFKLYHSRLAAVAWSTSVRNKAHLISLSFLAQINPTTLWLKSFSLWHKCVLDGPMLYIDSGISGIFMFALLSIPGNLTIPWWSLCEHSTNVCLYELDLKFPLRVRWLAQWTSS